MIAFDFAKLVDVGAVKAGLQSRPDEGRGTREAASVKRNAWLLKKGEWGFAIALERLPPPSPTTMERSQ
jgi:hypothetical protein